MLVNTNSLIFFFFLFTQSPEPSGIIDLRSFHVTEGNYTKRKHVFKLTSVPLPSSPSPITVQSSTTGTQLNQSTGSTQSAIVAGTELLIQADSHQDMKLWMESLRKASCMDSAKSLVCTIHLFFVICNVYFVVQCCMYVYFY